MSETWPKSDERARDGRKSGSAILDDGEKDKREGLKHRYPIRPAS